MTVYQFSQLFDGQQLSFNPGSDVLNFDQATIAAADVRFAIEGPSTTRISVGTKDVVLFNTTPLQLAISNMTFANGSRLLFGDNNVGTAGDNGNNILTGTAGADLFAGFGGNDTLDGAAGNDVFLMSSGNTTSYGADKLYGRDGIDTVYFGEYAQSGVTASLVGGSATGGGAAGAGSAGIYFMENIVGGGFNDNLTGDAAANRLEGG